jgi:hypothetical protein
MVQKGPYPFSPNDSLGFDFPTLKRGVPSLAWCSAYHRHALGRTPPSEKVLVIVSEVIGMISNEGPPTLRLCHLTRGEGMQVLIGFMPKRPAFGKPTEAHVVVGDVTALIFLQSPRSATPAGSLHIPSAPSPSAQAVGGALQPQVPTQSTSAARAARAPTTVAGTRFAGHFRLSFTI